jgi:hypothetical protein
VGRLEDLSIASRACGDDNLSVCTAAESAKILILIRHVPNDAFFQLLENRVTITDLIITQLRNQSESLSEENLHKGLKHRNPEIRRISLEKLIEKKRLSEFQLRELLNDSSNGIKRICYEAIIRLGGDVSLEEIKTSLGENWNLQNDMLTLLTTFFIFKPPQRLLNEISAISINTGLAYKVVATEHFNLVAEKIREDLENDFSGFVERQMKPRIQSDIFNGLSDLVEKIQNSSQQYDYINLQNERINEINEIIESYKDIFNKYYKYEFISGALSGLLLHGNQEDIVWGRKYLIKRKGITDSLRIEAIKIGSSGFEGINV